MALKRRVDKVQAAIDLHQIPKVVYDATLIHPTRIHVIAFEKVISQKFGTMIIGLP